MHSQELRIRQRREAHMRRFPGTSRTLVVTGFAAITLWAVFYLASGISRAVRMWVDGLPADMLVPASILVSIAWLLSLLIVAHRRMIK